MPNARELSCPFLGPRAASRLHHGSAAQDVYLISPIRTVLESTCSCFAHLIRVVLVKRSCDAHMSCTLTPVMSSIKHTDNRVHLFLSWTSASKIWPRGTKKVPHDPPCDAADAKSNVVNLHLHQYRVQGVVERLPRIHVVTPDVMESIHTCSVTASGHRLRNIES